MAVDDATAAFLAQMAAAGGPPIHEMTPQDARGLSVALGELYGTGPDMARVEDVAIPIEGGTMPCRVLAPTKSPRGVIVYYHGGGWVLGSIDDYETLGRQLAHQTGCAVVLVEYRLAPENRFPTAVEDSWSALRWAAEHVAELAGSGAPLIVAGDSAGGNLSAVMTLRAREAGGPDIAFQVLVYPVTDADLETPSYRDPENQLLLTRDTMIWFWDHYAPDPASRQSPDASPLKAPDLSGLPPAVVLTAEHDVLRDEGEAYAERLREAGVPVELRRFPGQMHGFFQMVNVLPGAAEGMAHVTAAIDKRLASLGD